MERKRTGQRQSHTALIRWPPRLRKSVAWLVIVCFMVNCLAPTAVAAKTLSREVDRYQTQAKSEVELSSDALATMEDTLDRMHRRLNGKFEYGWQETLAKTTHVLPPAAAKRADIAQQEAQLNQAAAQLEGYQGAITAYFATTRAQLTDHQLDGSIIARHDQQVTDYTSLLQQLKNGLTAIRSANDDASYQQAVAAAADFMHSHSSKPKRAAFDPSHLAFGPPKERAREALTDAAAIRAALQLPDPQSGNQASAKPSTLARFVTPANVNSKQAPVQAKVAAKHGARPSIAPTAIQTLSANLAPTEDVQITAAIQAKAAELGNNPLKIYQFVRNNVEYLPTYGSIEGSDYTLQTLRGNDIDEASLLIALLRAADIPAHYVYGTVQVPIEQVENWVGNVTDPIAALDLMGQGGIPTLGLAQGGVIKFAQIEHVWVEAQFGFSPSRGAVTTPGSSWVPMDPSFKNYTYSAPLVTPDMLPNADTLRNNIANSAVVSLDGYSATSFNTTALTDAMAFFKQNLASNIQTQGGHPTLIDLFGQKTIVSENLPILAGSLPYRVVTYASRFDTLPSSLRLTAHIQLAQGSTDSLGSTEFDFSTSLAALAQSSLMLSASGSSPAAQAAWDSFDGGTDFPAYLISVTQALTLDGAVVATSGPATAGSSYVVSVAISGAGTSRSVAFDVTAGDSIQLGFDTGGLNSSAAQGLLSRSDFGSEEGNLYLAAKSYWLTYGLLTQAMSRMHKTVDVRLPSVGLFSAPISIVYSFGIPFRASYHSHQVDIKLNHSAVVAQNGNRSTTIAYVESAGLTASFLEGFVPEELFSKLLGYGSNTARLLQLANDNANPIHFITAANVSSQIALLSQSSDAMTDVANAIGAGYTVTMPRFAQTNHSWIGTGYAIRDNSTGSGDYRINGGLNGDSQTECQRVTKPVPVKYPRVSLISTLLLAASPIFIDDDGNINTGGIAVATLAVVAIVILSVGTGGIADAVGAVLGPVAARAGLGLMALLGMDEAFAAGEDDCSCTAQPLGYHRGGNTHHNYCADVVPPNQAPGSDWLLSGKAFDSLSQDKPILWEVKTGKWSYYPATLQKIVLTKFLLEFQQEKENATSCNYAFTFGVTDMGLAAAMSVATFGDPSVQVIGCP